MIFMLLGLGVINFADRAVLGLAALSIMRELHLSPAQYGLASGSFFLLYALSSVLVTAWSDRIGTKRVLALLATSWAIKVGTALARELGRRQNLRRMKLCGAQASYTMRKHHQQAGLSHSTIGRTTTLSHLLSSTTRSAYS